jgi:hypothetical protein
VHKISYEDPYWQAVLKIALEPYIEDARKWWLNKEKTVIKDTGVSEIQGSKPLLFQRFTRVAARSPIKGIQAFPFLPTARLQLKNILGGSTKMIQNVCRNNKFKLEEFTIVCKANLPSTFNQAQFVAFIPTHVLEQNIEKLGEWIYLTREELSALTRNEILKTVKAKAILKI